MSYICTPSKVKIIYAISIDVPLHVIRPMLLFTIVQCCRPISGTSDRKKIEER